MNTYEIRSYTDDEGKLITARISINSETLKTEKVLVTKINPDGISDGILIDKAKFFGTYSVPHPSGRAMRVEFEFPENWSLQKCFVEFEAQAKADFERITREAQEEQKAKLWTPDQGKQGLFVPGKG